VYNLAILVGRLGQDPQPQVTTGGVTFCRFSVACQRQFKSRDGEKETDWIDIVAWRERAEFCANYMRKGSLVLVEGPIQVRKWETSDGQPRRSVEVLAERVEILSSKSSSDGGAASVPRDEDAPRAAAAKPPAAEGSAKKQLSENFPEGADDAFDSADDEYDPFGGE
jgi:single-strand DNA-binding protein